MKDMENKIEKIREYLILAIVFLLPLTFAGAFIDQLNLPKLIIFGILISLLVIVMAIQIYLTGKIEYAKGRFDLGVFLIALAYLLSGIFVTPNKVEAFFLPGNASFLLGFGILYFLLNTIPDRNKIKYALIASGVTLSIFVFAGFLGVFGKIPHLPAFMKSGIFNPTGDYLTGVIFLIATVPFAVTFVIKENEIVKKLIFSFSLVFILIAIGISIFTLVSPDKKAAPLLPSFETSWSVAIDSIKESPVLGIGPGNYLTAFNRFRPITYNLTNLWQLRFSTGRDFYLTILTESGLLGILGVGLILITFTKVVDRSLSIYKESRSLLIDPITTSTLILLLVLIAIFPISATTLLVLFVLLSLNSQAKQSHISIDSGKSQTPRVLLAILLIALVAVGIMKVKPVIAGEIIFREANDAITANNGKKTYDLLQKAIASNQYVDRYHASYAQVSLAIARSIASSQPDPKNLTDDQKNMILQLIQQSIKEGQNTVALNPSRAANWQVLSNIYQVVIPYANQADAFAIQSYNQTVNLDPADPNLRILFGELYFSLGQYDNAITTFQFAALAKPDLANAYYNLAASYAAKNDFTNAIANMNKVFSLVQKDTNDYKVAQQGLEDLQKKQKSLQETTPNSSLTTPEKQTKVINPTLNLSKESSPPAGPTLPTPTPTFAPTTEGGLPITPSPNPTPTTKP